MTSFPDGACDTHMHVYDARHPAAPTATLFPPDASIDDYRLVQAALGLRRVVVVQPSTYGLDNSCQIAAAGQIGDDARLVVVVDETVDESELERLTALGARGARFHMLPGGAVGWDRMRPVADRIADHGWHIQLQMDGNRLGERTDLLRSLPVPVVVDHVGRFMPPPGPDSPAFGHLLDLLGTGRCWVKLSAPYESTQEGAPTYPAVAALVEVLVERFPDRLLWASNWPHPGRHDAPDADALRSLATTWLPTEAIRRQVLVRNPAIVYGYPT